MEEMVNMTNAQKEEFEKCSKQKNKRVACMKKAIIWNEPRKNIYRFEHPSFNTKQTKDITKLVATKFKALLDKITMLDKSDNRVNKKLFKHVIFVDEPKFVKLLVSVLMANDYKFIFDATQRKRGNRMVNTLALKELKKSKHNKNFGIFTKGSIHNRVVSRKLVSKVNKAFNERPDNIHGEKLRFIIIDKNYLEGVSFFDTKYFHVLTEPNTKFEMEQLVGRVVRTCGHKGLPFNTKGREQDKGWIINVLIYNSMHSRVNYDKLIKKAIQDALSKDDAQKIKIQDLIIKEIQDNAFDKLLTQAIH